MSDPSHLTCHLPHNLIQWHPPAAPIITICPRPVLPVGFAGDAILAGVAINPETIQRGIDQTRDVARWWAALHGMMLDPSYDVEATEEGMRVYFVALPCTSKRDAEIVRGILFTHRLEHAPFDPGHMRKN